MNYDFAIVNTFSVGPGWYKSKEAITLNLEPEFYNNYVSYTNTKNIATGEWFLGIETKKLAQIGLLLQTTSNANINGIVWELNDPSFDNFNYKYKLTHTSVGIKGKVFAKNLEANYKILPYVSASLGVGFNRSSNFTLTPLIYSAVTAPSFQNHTQTSFTYTIGAGLEKILTNNWRLGVGYEFTDFGKSSLDPAPGQISNNSLSLNHLYINQLIFNLSYLF